MSVARAMTQYIPVLIEGPVTKTTTYNGVASADLTGYEGVARVVVASGAGGAGATMDCKVQDSANGSSGWADVAGATMAQVGNSAAVVSAAVNLDETKPYLRVVATIGGTASFTYTTVIVAARKTSSGS